LVKEEMKRIRRLEYRGKPDYNKSKEFLKSLKEK